MEVEVLDEEGTLSTDSIRHLESIVDFACRRLCLGRGSLTVAIVSIAKIKDLHRDYFDDDSPTDVITFPAMGEWVDGGDVHLGDVVICSDVAREQAAEHGLTFVKEVEFLALHGVLHIAGYEDDTWAKRRRMWGLQKDLMQAFEQACEDK